MPKFQVLRPVEHNQILYLPKDSAAAAKVKSAGHGQDIPVDASGTIDLETEGATALTSGQIAPLEGPPESASQSKRTRR